VDAAPESFENENVADTSKRLCLCGVYASLTNECACRLDCASVVRVRVFVCVCVDGGV
jgi:hypothetical protein